MGPQNWSTNGSSLLSNGKQMGQMDRSGKNENDNENENDIED